MNVNYNITVNVYNGPVASSVASWVAPRVIPPPLRQQSTSVRSFGDRDSEIIVPRHASLVFFFVYTVHFLTHTSDMSDFIYIYI